MAEDIVRPEDIEADSREEMRCPSCGRKTLQEHAAARKLSSEREKILYGSTCSNQDCELSGKRIEAERLKPQYAGGGLFSKLSEKVTKENAKNAAFVLIALVVIIQLFSSLLGGGGAIQVTGTVVDYNGQPVQGATVVVNGQELTTGSDGKFSGKVNSEQVKVYANPPNGDNPLGSTKIYNGTIRNGTLYIGNSSKITLPRAYTYEIEGTGTNMKTTVEFASRINANKTVVTLGNAPVESEVTERNITFNSQGQRQQINGQVMNQNITLTVPVEESVITKTITFDGSQQKIDVGNVQQIQDSQIRVPEQTSTTEEQTARKRVKNTASFNINISSNEAREVTAILSRGSSETQETISGKWGGDDPTITISEDGAPASTRVTLTGQTTSTEQTVSGKIDGSEITFDVGGNKEAKNGVIEFTGGEQETTEIGSGEVSASGQNGVEYKTKTLGTVETSGTYILDLRHMVEQNSDLVSAGYIIDGDKKTISEGEMRKEVNLNSGETVKLWVEARSEASSPSSEREPSESNIEITEYTAQPKEPDVGESVSVDATINNPSDERDSIDIRMYVDGVLRVEKTFALDPGESKTVDIGSTSFDEKGVHSVSLNALDEKIIKVGGAEVAYGVGSISGTLSKTAGNGTVSVDTDGDSSFDCTVSASNGKCELGSLSPGTQSIQVREQGVSNTGWKVTFTERTATENVRVDVNNDGQFDKTKETLASGEMIQVTKELDAGEHTINIETAVGDVSYEVVWSKAGQISNPKVSIDGTVVIDGNQTFSGPKEVSLGRLSPGEHTVRFESPQGAYSVRLKWTEKPEQTYPPVTIGGEVICTSEQLSNNDGVCNIPGELLMNEEPIDLGSYNGEINLRYTERSIPETVRVQRNGNTVLSINTTDEGEIVDGVWRYEESDVRILTEGTNNIFTAPRGEATVTYRVARGAKKAEPVIIIRRNGQTYNYSINASKMNNGTLSQQTSFNIGPVLRSGNNTIIIRSTNGRPIKARVTARTTIEQNATFKHSD